MGITSFATESSYSKKPELPVEVRRGSFGIVPTLYDYVASKRRQFTPSNVYASNLKNCMREQVLGLLGYPQTKPEKVKDNPQYAVVAKWGDGIHTLVEGWLKQTGFSVKSEFRVSDANLSGKVDAIVAIENGTNQAILDVKTVGNRDFKSASKSYKFPGYIAQISVYGRLLNINLGYVLLVNRDTGEMAEYEFDIDAVYADGLLERAELIMNYVKGNVVPEAEFYNTPSCNFCWFKNECEKIGTKQTAL